MKNRIFFTVTVLMFCSGIMAQSGSKNKYTVTVDISSMQPKPEKIILTYYDYELKERIADTAAASSGKVVFKGTLNEPVLALLNQYPAISLPVVAGGNVISGKGRVPSYVGTGFYLEPGKIKIRVLDSIKSIKVSGSNTQKDYEQLQAMKKPYSQKQNEVQANMAEYSKAKDSVNLAKAIAGSRAIIAEQREKVLKPYILEHANNSPVVLIALQEYADYGRASYDEFEEIFNKLSPEYQSMPSAIALKQRIFTSYYTSIGAIAPDFTQNDTLDRPVSLSSFRGKYVLVDFWASWCGPCRKENPNLVKSFNRFKDKSFTVLGVSLDQPGKKDAWLKAIHDDQLTWTHVSDLKYWNNAVAKMYGINGVPASFLLDPQGKIIAKNLRGAELDKKLEEILGN